MVPSMPTMGRLSGARTIRARFASARARPCAASLAATKASGGKIRYRLPAVLDSFIDWCDQTREDFKLGQLIDEELTKRQFKAGLTLTYGEWRRMKKEDPAALEAYLRLRTLPGEQAQVDWGSFGKYLVDGTQRPLSAFVMVLSWSRAIFVDFSFDQQMETFLRMHRARHTYDPSLPLEPWAYAIARHAFLMERRRAARARETPLGDDQTAVAQTAEVIGHV